jgi:hypothetical protein
MRTFLVFYFAVFSLASFSQDQDTIPKRNSYVIGFTPSSKHNIFGLSLGIIGSESICNLNYTRKSHGLNIQLIGQGIFVPLNYRNFSFDKQMSKENGFMYNNIILRESYRAIHNGILFSTFGTYTDQTNGLCISLLASLGYEMNGVAFNFVANKYFRLNGIALGLVNHSGKVNGIQIGLVNKTVHLKGLQIGLWNVNSKRKLPIINWGF